MRKVLALLLFITFVFNLVACNNDEQVKITCSNCNKSIPISADFCEYCDTAIGKTKTESTTNSSDNSTSNETAESKAEKTSKASSTSTTKPSNKTPSTTVSTEQKPADNTIPEGGIYFISVSNKTLSQGKKFPTKPQHYDTYTYEDYKYTFDNSLGGWAVSVIHKDKVKYSSVLSSIAGAPIKSLYYTFRGCTKMKESPAIPHTVTDMTASFMDCSSLRSAPTLPESVKSLSFAFSYCKSLVSAPKIPSGVTDLTRTFEWCSSLTKAPEIPNNVTNMLLTFSNCRSLVIAPQIPNGVTYLSYAFENCYSLTTAPAVIPRSVETMRGAFKGCEALTGEITVNAILSGDESNESPINSCFDGTAKPIILIGSNLLPEFNKWENITIK